MRKLGDTRQDTAGSLPRAPSALEVPLGPQGQPPESALSHALDFPLTTQGPLTERREHPAHSHTSPFGTSAQPRSVPRDRILSGTSERDLAGKWGLHIPTSFISRRAC